MKIQSQALLPKAHEQPILRVTTMQARMDEAIAPYRFNMLLFSVFAGTALLLAVCGIYGVMAFLVAQRTHEIGIRMALGAQNRDVLRLVIGQGMTMALIGVVIGLGCALALTRLLKKMLFGVSATDPWTFAIVVLMLLGVALVFLWWAGVRSRKSVNEPMNSPNQSRAVVMVGRSICHSR